MSTIDSVRARAARATWVSVCAVLLAAVTAHAESPARNQENPGQDLPVVATVPTDEAVRVRPDTAVSFQLDTQSPEFRAFRQQLESGRFAIQVEDGSSAQLFLGEQRSNGKGQSQPSAGEATFDAQKGTVSTPALSLRRYTTYTVTLAVKAAYEALLHGQPLPGNDSYSFAFITGSALREPTRYGFRIHGEQSPRVTGKVTLTVSAIDDYGNAASGSNLAVSLTEDGSRLPSSAVVTPARTTLPASGSADFVITDTEAEWVRVSIQASGAHPENAWSHSSSVRFRPGLPTKALLTDMPAQAQVGSSLTVKGTVVDVYGNAVEDGTPVSVGGKTVTTEAGAFSVTQLLPTLVADYTVQVRSGYTLLGSAVIRLLPGDPAGIRDLMAPYSAVVGSSFDVSGEVHDWYGNLVLDGTSVTVNGAATTTKAGRFSVPVTAPTTPGSLRLVITAGGRLTTYMTVQVRSGPPSAITGVTAPESVVVASGFNVCGAVQDSYGNAVTDGTAVTVNSVATTTKTGAFCAAMTAPTKSGPLSLLIKAGTVSTSRDVQVRSGAPAALNGVTVPASVVVGSGVNVCGQVADAYGNAVTDGTAVTVNTEATTTTGGAFCAAVTAPTKPGSLAVLIKAGTVSTSRTVQVNIGPAAAFINLTSMEGVIVASTFTVCGQVADAYGNVLPTGTLVTVNGFTVSAAGNGIFCAPVSPPTKTGPFDVVLQSGPLSLTKSIQVRSGTTTTINNVSHPASVVVGSSFSVCGSAWDAYGNAASDGTSVTVNGVATTTTTTTAGTGYFCATVPASMTAGSFPVTIKSGSATSQRSVLAISGPVATLTDFSVPETVELNATFQACATAKDAYGNLVANGTMAYVSGGVTSSVTTSTQAGRFCAQLTAPSSAMSFAVEFTVYDATTSRSVSASRTSRSVAPQPASITLTVTPSSGSVPADGTTTAALSAYVTDKNGLAVVNGFPGTWTTTLGTLTVGTSTTSAGVVSASLRSSVVGTATVTVTVGTISRSVTVTFTSTTPPSAVASIGGVSYAQSTYNCSGAANATYKNFGFGTYFRPQQGCTLYVYGTAYTSTGALAKNAVVTVTVRVDGAVSPMTITAMTDATGRFTATPYVPLGYGGRIYSYTVWDPYWRYYRRVTDYWDWGYLSISSGGGQTLFSDKFYAVNYTY
jgi:hypothetical protein